METATHRAKPEYKASPHLDGECNFTHDSVAVASREQVSCDLSGESVILDLRAGIYYGLNEVGARIWSLIQDPRPLSEICGALLSEYDVDAARCESDLVAILRSLKAAGLVEIYDEVPA
jgi:hypothetical protein